MQESLLLISELERDQEARSLDQVVPVVLCSTFDDLLVIFQLVCLQDISSFIIVERVVVEGLLIVAVSVILERAHTVRGHRSLVHAPESLHT